MSQAEIIAAVLRAPGTRIGAPPKAIRGAAAKWPIELDRWIYDEARAIKARGEAPSMREACRKIVERFVERYGQFNISRRNGPNEGTTAGKIKMGGAILYERLQYYRRRMDAQDGATTLAALFR
jgi:hypothetical protein